MRMQLYLDIGATFGINSFSKMRTIYTVMNIFLLVQCWTNWILGIGLETVLHTEKWGWKQTLAEQSSSHHGSFHSEDCYQPHQQRMIFLTE